MDNEALMIQYKLAIDELINANEMMFSIGIMSGMALSGAMLLIYAMLGDIKRKKRHPNL